jgi:hypothetical protein
LPLETKGPSYTFITIAATFFLALRGKIFKTEMLLSFSGKNY